MTNYSFGSASVIVPPVTEGDGTGDAANELAQYRRQHEAAGRLRWDIAQNSQVSKDGIARHETQDHVRDARQAGIDIVQISPIQDDLSTNWMSTGSRHGRILM